MASKTKLPLPNKTLEKMIESAGGQSELARMVADETGEVIYQSYIWRYTYEQGQVPERLVVSFLKICQEQLSLKAVTAHKLRPSMPVLA